MEGQVHSVKMMRSREPFGITARAAAVSQMQPTETAPSKLATVVSAAAQLPVPGASVVVKLGRLDRARLADRPAYRQPGLVPAEQSCPAWSPSFYQRHLQPPHHGRPATGPVVNQVKQVKRSRTHL